LLNTTTPKLLAVTVLRTAVFNRVTALGVTPGKLNSEGASA